MTYWRVQGEGTGDVSAALQALQGVGVAGLCERRPGAASDRRYGGTAGGPTPWASAWPSSRPCTGWADPDAALVEIVHRHGALACWQIGSHEEAVAAVAAGCDFLIAQGVEAGGHVRGRIGMLVLLNEVLSTVAVPVLAAGGIGSGRAMAAALAAGAEGVRVGTRFLAAEEAEAHPDSVQTLIAARPHDTVHTEAFGADWPITAPHRLLRSCLQAAEAFQGEVVGEGRNHYTGQRHPIVRFATDAIHKSYTGAIEAMSLWAGESVGGVQRIESAADIVSELAGEAERLLRRWC